MCHLSPTVHLAWAVLSCALQIFLVQHLWRYDRFKCLAWSSGRQPGAFKRVMTYSYLASVPTLVVYSISMAVLKYRNGYKFIPEHGIIPTPFQLWPAQDQEWLTPLYILFSIAWGLELVTHLEELTFWLFLLHQGPARRDWFSSIEFQAWATASVVAVTGMPITAIFTRAHPLTSEAYIFLIGGAASLCVTAAFFVVLAQFPEFLRRVKKEGAASPVVLRLVKFHELNILRVIFRLLMTVPLIILGVDGIYGHHIINENQLWTDLFAFLAALGTVVSSTLTLMVFFPRSLAEDSNWRPRTVQTQSHGSWVSGGTADRLHGRNRAVLNVKLPRGDDADADTYTDADEHEIEVEVETESPNPFSNPADASKSGTPSLMTSKTKSGYFTGHFAKPSTYNIAYYPPTLVAGSGARLHEGDYELRNIEEAGGNEREETDAHEWHISNSETGLNVKGGENVKGDKTTTTTLGTETAGRRSSKDSSAAHAGTGKDQSQMTVRMIELGKAVDAGLRNPPSRPPRPPRLHPYITSFTSPIDLMQYDGADIPRAI